MYETFEADNLQGKTYLDPRLQRYGPQSLGPVVFKPIARQHNIALCGQECILFMAAKKGRGERPNACPMVWSHSTRLCLLKVPPPLKSIPGFQGPSRSTLYQKLYNGCLLGAGAERIRNEALQYHWE